MAIDPTLVYVNGIDPETGAYAFPPRSIDDLARAVRADPAVSPYSRLFGTELVSFKAPFGVELEDIKEAGWGIIFPEDTSQDVHTALSPLLEARRQQTRFFMELDYKKGSKYATGIVATTSLPEISIANSSLITYFLSDRQIRSRSSFNTS